MLGTFTTQSMLLGTSTTQSMLGIVKLPNTMQEAKHGIIRDFLGFRDFKNFDGVYNFSPFPKTTFAFPISTIT